MPESSTETQPLWKRAPRGCGGVFFFLLVCLAGVWGACLGAFVWMLDGAQAEIDALDDFRPRIGSRVYSADGELLAEFAKESRRLVRLSEMPLDLQKAFIAAEDDMFYRHKGVRPDAIINTALYIARTQEIRGASTITMQIVRNIEALGVGTERTMQRKIREALVSLQVERMYTKDEILELYLNQIFLGSNAYGVEAASQHYFGKSCVDLTLSESALLAGLTSSPNNYRPDFYPDKASERRAYVLRQMWENGFITDEERERAAALPVEDLVLTSEERAELLAEGRGGLATRDYKAPYFVEEVRQYLLETGVVSATELYEGGLEIQTTLDMRLQRAAERAMDERLDNFDENQLKKLERRDKLDEFVPVTGALVCLDNRQGHEGRVRAMYGGRDFATSKYNTATQARRQPGSSVKPFVWSAALDSGMTPSTVILDERFVRHQVGGGAWAPENFGGRYRGPITLRRALEKSVNTVSIRLVDKLGVPFVRSYMERCRLGTNFPNGLSLALGVHEVTPMQQCAAYAAFANNGVYTAPVLITSIRNRDGFTIWESPASSERVLEPPVAYSVCYLLEGVATRGTGARGTAPLEDRPRGGKTGTTNDSRDVWFSGFTMDYTTVAWLGYSDNRPLGSGRDVEGRQYTGGSQACPAWTAFMLEAHKGLPKREFPVPGGVEFHPVDRETGVAWEHSVQGERHMEVFIRGRQPPVRQPVLKGSERIDEELESEALVDFNSPMFW